MLPDTIKRCSIILTYRKYKITSTFMFKKMFVHSAITMHQVVDAEYCLETVLAL